MNESARLVREPGKYVEIFILISATIIAALYVATTISHYHAEKRAIELAQQRNTEQMRDLFDDAMRRLAYTLYPLTEAPLLREGNLERFHEYALGVVKKTKGVLNIVLHDENRLQILNTSVSFGQPIEAGKGEVNEDLTQRALRTGEPTYAFTFGKITKQWLVIVGMPVEVKGHGQAMLSITIAASNVAELLQSQIGPHQLSVVATDRTVTPSSERGQIVARAKWKQSEVHQESVGRTVVSEFLEAAHTGEAWKESGAWQGINHEGIEIYTGYARSRTTGWVVAVGVPTSVLYEPLVPQQQRLMALAFALVVLGILLYWLLNKKNRELKLAHAQVAQAYNKLELVNRELRHRHMNAYTQAAMVVRLAPDPKTASDRLFMLGQVVEWVAEGAVRAFSVREVLFYCLAPFQNPSHTIVYEGEEVLLPARKIQNFAFICKELVTNALKYGAFSRPDGRVEVRWNTHNGRFFLTWCEKGGPPVSAPSREGGGSQDLPKFAEALGGTITLNFDPEGFNCALEFPLES